MRKTKQLLIGIFLGGILSPLLVNCSTDMVKTASSRGGRMLQDAGRALLADAGQLLMDSGHAMEDAGQAIGDSGAIRDAEAQTTGGGGVCYVMWDTNTPRCGADFSEVYSGYAFTPFVKGTRSGTTFPQGYVRTSDGITAAIASPLCVKSGRPEGSSVSRDYGPVYFQAGGKSVTDTLRCAVCCK